MKDNFCIITLYLIDEYQIDLNIIPMLKSGLVSYMGNNYPSFLKGFLILLRILRYLDVCMKG